MVVSSGFLGHVLVSERSEAFLRSNGLITAAQSLNTPFNRQQQVSLSINAMQCNLNLNFNFNSANLVSEIFLDDAFNDFFLKIKSKL